jgi:hypothetical protein
MLLLDAIPWFGPWRIKRDADKYRLWCALLDTRRNGAEVFQIVGIRQHARTGLKAYGRWIESGETCAVWIEGAWPSVGMFMSAPGSYGDGRHHGGNVFYVQQPYYFLEERGCLAVRRHLARNHQTDRT